MCGIVGVIALRSWLTWIGQINYRVVAVHRCLIIGCTAGSFPHFWFSIQTGLTVPLAAASRHLSESPILRQKARWPMPSNGSKVSVSWASAQ